MAENIHFVDLKARNTFRKLPLTLIVNWQNFINRRDMQDWIWICVIPCLQLILPTIITKRRKGKRIPHRDSVKRQNGVRHEARDY